MDSCKNCSIYQSGYLLLWLLKWPHIIWGLYPITMGGICGILLCSTSCCFPCCDCIIKNHSWPGLLTCRSLSFSFFILKYPSAAWGKSMMSFIPYHLFSCQMNIVFIIIDRGDRDEFLVRFGFKSTFSLSGHCSLINHSRQTNRWTKYRWSIFECGWRTCSIGSNSIEVSRSIKILWLAAIGREIPIRPYTPNSRLIVL